MLMAFATTFGYKAERSKTAGSLYIQTLCRILEANDCCDAVKVFRAVNNEVASITKQMPIYQHTLRKLCLRPHYRH